MFVYIGLLLNFIGSLFLAFSIQKNPGGANQMTVQTGHGDQLGNGSTRRKNATRETTATLKAWLYEHRKNPYPTKGEKIMLAILTKMSLNQVSTWFANARRRLKKENKMTFFFPVSFFCFTHRHLVCISFYYFVKNELKG